MDQAQRIHRGEQRSPVAFCAVADPPRLIRPTTAARFMVGVQFWQRQYRPLSMNLTFPQRPRATSSSLSSGSTPGSPTGLGPFTYATFHPGRAG